MPRSVPVLEKSDLMMIICIVRPLGFHLISHLASQVKHFTLIEARKEQKVRGQHLKNRVDFDFLTTGWSDFSVKHVIRIKHGRKELMKTEHRNTI